MNKENCNTPIIEVSQLSHKYSSQWAVKDINFSIGKAGIYGLLGSNGAGKSTTMNIMCGVLKQTEGEIIVDGINLSDNPIGAKKLIGFLPQLPPLYLDTTVEEYLVNCAYLRLIPKKQISEAVHEVLNKCDIFHFRNRLLRNLSGGYKQRVGIAQAIIHKPKLIILDEPTNGLDPNQILEVRDLIKNIAEDRVVMLSTHMLSEVQAICEKIIMIDQGKMVFSGDLDHFNNYVVPNSIFVRLKNNPTIDQLKAIDCVESVDMLSDSGYRIQTSNKENAVRNIVEASVKKDWFLDEIRVEKSSLNEVFAVLSKKNK